MRCFKLKCQCSQEGVDGGICAPSPSSVLGLLRSTTCWLLTTATSSLAFFTLASPQLALITLHPRGNAGDTSDTSSCGWNTTHGSCIVRHNQAWSWWLCQCREAKTAKASCCSCCCCRDTFCMSNGLAACSSSHQPLFHCHLVKATSMWTRWQDRWKT